MEERKNLLRQIEEEAVDSKSDVASLLRKCQVLASRLQNEALKCWVRRELSGYKAREELPPYRVIPCNSLGNFCGFGGRALNHAPIPPSCVPEKYRSLLSEFLIMDGVGELQSIAKNVNAGETLSQPWPADLIALVSRDIYRNMSMVSAYKACPITTVVGVLEVIRNRILDFVLELEEKCPEAGEAIDSTTIGEKELDQMVTTNIFKGNGNVAFHCGTATQQYMVSIEKGNWNMLERFLQEIKIESDKINELKDILQKEPPKSKNEWGSRISAWMGSVCAKAATGIYSIPFDVISGVLANAISKYWGVA